jgi:hypothetical protein
MQIPSTPSQDALNDKLDQIRAELNESQVKRWEDQHNNKRRLPVDNTTRLRHGMPTTPSDAVYRAEA